MKPIMPKAAPRVNSPSKINSGNIISAQLPNSTNGYQTAEIICGSNCVAGQETVVGTASKLQGLAAIQASDQDTLDNLERQRALTRKRQEVQSAKTGLARETARTSKAETKVDLELDTHRSVNQAIRDSAKNPVSVVIK